MRLPENLWVVAWIVFGGFGSLAFIILVIRLFQTKSKSSELKVRVDELLKENKGMDDHLSVLREENAVLNKRINETYSVRWVVSEPAERRR